MQGSKKPDPFRERMRFVQKESDIDEIWVEQKKLRREDELLQEKYTRAREEAKQLKRTIRINQLGESLHKHERSLNKLKTAKKSTAVYWSKLNKKSRSFIGVIAIVMLLVGLHKTTQSNRNSPETLETTSSSVMGEATENPIKKERPAFDMLVPEGKTIEDLETVRISPEGAAPSYTFIDQLGENGTQIQVTQQQVPDNFDIAKTAKDFQATSVIQINDTSVYHGYSEKGRVQSLVFTYEKLLILIRSPQKLEDEQWVGYIHGLLK